MKFSVKKDELKKALALVSSVAKKSVSEYTTKVMFESNCEYNEINVVCTDLDVIVSACVDAELQEQAIFSFCVDSKLIQRVVDSCSKEIYFECSNKLDVVSGEFAFSMPVTSTEFYPFFKNNASGAEIRIDPSHFIENIAYCCAYSEARPYMQCVNFEISDGDIHAFASDGRRCAWVGEHGSNSSRVLVRSTTLLAAAKAFGNKCIMNLGSNYCSIRSDDSKVAIIERVLDGGTDDLIGLLMFGDIVLSVNRNEFVSAISNVGVVSEQCWVSVRDCVMSVNGMSDKGSYNQKINIFGDDVKFSACSKYMLDAAKRITSENILIRADRNGECPILIENEINSLVKHAVMPMRW